MRTRRRAGVLDRVGHRLGDDVPGGGLDLLGVADTAQRRVGLDHDLQRQPGGLGLDRLQQPLVGQDRRMDRVGELAQPGEQVAQVPLELGERARRRAGRRGAAARGPARGSRSAPRGPAAAPSCRSRWMRWRSASWACTSLAREAVSSAACRRMTSRRSLSSAVSCRLLAAVAAWAARLRQQAAVLVQQRAVAAGAALDAPEHDVGSRTMKARASGRSRATRHAVRRASPRSAGSSRARRPSAAKRSRPRGRAAPGPTAGRAPRVSRRRAWAAGRPGRARSPASRRNG